MDTNDPFVPIEDVAKHFHVSVSTVRAWVRQDMIPSHTYVKLGNTYRFSIARIVSALTSQNGAKEEDPAVEEAEPEADAPVQLELDFGNPDEDV